jgi:hypothetical protein
MMCLASSHSTWSSTLCFSASGVVRAGAGGTEGRLRGRGHVRAVGALVGPGHGDVSDGATHGQQADREEHDHSHRVLRMLRIPPGWASPSGSG